MLWLPSFLNDLDYIKIANIGQGSYGYSGRAQRANKAATLAIQLIIDPPSDAVWAPHTRQFASKMAHDLIAPFCILMTAPICP